MFCALFFTLIFLTFVFAYVQSTSVDRLAPFIKSRSVRVIVVALIILSLLIALGAFLVPPVRVEAKIFVDRVPNYMAELDSQLSRLAETYPSMAQFFPRLVGEHKHSVGADLIQELLGFGKGSAGGKNVKEIFSALRDIGTGAFAIASAFLLSLLFSFLIVLDLPSLTRSAQELANSKLRFIYVEAADTIVDFCRVLGRALEAQLLIAMFNTLLTAIGLFILGLGQKVAFLSMIVFLCSFIPVAGVFISSVPICLVALQENGLYLCFVAIALITVIHLIECYILNPKIYGHHLRMNPVIVLIILTIGGQLFHVWGLILGVPICTYIFGHAIRNQPDEIPSGFSHQGVPRERGPLNPTPPPGV